MFDCLLLVGQEQHPSNKSKYAATQNVQVMCRSRRVANTPSLDGDGFAIGQAQEVACRILVLSVFSKMRH